MKEFLAKEGTEMREHKRTTEIRNRCLKVAYYIKDTGMTIREVASVFHMSKSTVYMDMMFRLKEFNPILYNDIQEILQKSALFSFYN